MAFGAYDGVGEPKEGGKAGFCRMFARAGRVGGNLRSSDLREGSRSRDGPSPVDGTRRFLRRR